MGERRMSGCEGPRTNTRVTSLSLCPRSFHFPACFCCCRRVLSLPHDVFCVSYHIMESVTVSNFTINYICHRERKGSTTTTHRPVELLLTFWHLRNSLIIFSDKNEGGNNILESVKNNWDRVRILPPLIGKIAYRWLPGGKSNPKNIESLAKP